MRFTACAGATLVPALLVLFVPSSAQAQTAVTFSAGPAEYDLSGTGWSGTVAGHYERVVLPWLRVEAGSGAFWYTPQFAGRIMMLIPEVGVAFQAPRAFPVYLGMGAGHTLTVRGDHTNDPTLHGALGFSLAPNEEWRIRPEMRVRAVDPWIGVIAGFTLGVSKRVGVTPGAG